MILSAIHQWHLLWLVRRGFRVHAETDPTCRLHRPPRPGSRLDRASRGWSCRVCESARFRQIDEVTSRIGLELLPWQRNVIERVLRGERLTVVHSRRAGWSTTDRVLQELGFARMK